jgi:hypothetical protein
MEILRKYLYSTPIRTLTQEYIANARDAHRAANKENEPIQITLPSRDELILKIRDFGAGLSPEQMKNTFTLYGESTKRSDDGYNGGFGIGAKSGWAYSDNFMIITYVDGIAYHYSAYIDENNEGKLSLLSSVSSDKPSGTEIQIPIKQDDQTDFIRAVCRATFFWKIRPTILNIDSLKWSHSSILQDFYLNQKPDFKFNNFEAYQMKCSEFSQLFPSYRNDQKVVLNSGLVITIDEIPYIAQNDLLNKTPEISEFLSHLESGNTYVIHLKNEDCKVAASRENISSSDQTKQKLQFILFKLQSDLLKEKKTLASTPDSFNSFLRTRISLARFFKFNFKDDSIFYSQSSKLTYSFHNLESYKIDDDFLGKHTTITKMSRDINYKLIFSKGLSISANEKLVYLDEDLTEMGVKRRLGYLIDSKTSTITLLTKSKNYDEQFEKFMDETNVTRISDYKNKAPKRERTTRIVSNDPITEINIFMMSGRGWSSSAASFASFNYNLENNELNNFPAKKKHKIVYYSYKNKKAEKECSSYYSDLSELFFDLDGYVLGRISEESINIVKDNPHFISLESFIANTPETLKTVLLNQYRLSKLYTEWFKAFIEKIDNINDPELKRVLTEIKNTPRQLKKLYCVNRMYPGSSQIEKIDEDTTTTLNSINKRYPICSNLMSYYVSNHADELIFYINAKYEASKNG